MDRSGSSVLPAGLLATPLCAVLFATIFLASPAIVAADEGWVPLFDGKTLAAWKASENAASFRVVDGTIACDGPRSHLFYVGKDGTASFENFEAHAEVRARAGANSGFYFHTAYQEKDWPAQGFEVQVDNSQKEHEGYLENKMTGSLYGIRNVYKAMAKDDEWFTLDVTVQKPRVQVRVNGTLVVDWIEPSGPLPASAGKVNRLGHGTFALQCHDPGSKVFFRNIRVKPLPAGPAVAAPMPVVDERYAQILSLGRDNFPLVDLHAHLKGGLTIEQALALSRATGMFLGVAVNCGKGFPIQDDAAALKFLKSMEGQPVFVAMQAEGREWVNMFSKETRAKFDYVFTDSMTWTNPAGKRMRLWMPDEVEIGPDPVTGSMDASAREQAFMDLLVEKTVGILETEPIDVYVNPTFLPAAIASRYDTLWTKARMTRVIDAAIKNGVAIEINARYRLPSEAFLRLAKSKGAKFTFGTNNGGANDIGDWSYPLDMQKKLDLKWQDMFVPGHHPSRALRE